MELDADQELALELVERICAKKLTATVMVYCARHDADLMVASMRVGAREFLSAAVEPAVLREALERAMARNAIQEERKISGRTLVFWSPKGGSGVSTLAANFAIALRWESEAPVLLADLNPQLGSISVLLGMTPRFTVDEALRSARRLDPEFVSTLVGKHKSGISVISAPDEFSPSVEIEGRAVGKFLDIARNQFSWVVVDAGPGMGSHLASVFEMSSVIYLVAQLDIPSLHSAQRFIAYNRRSGGHLIEVVVNRYDARRTDFDEEAVSKALGLNPKWKIPNDYAAASRAANTGDPLMTQRSAAASAIRAMARSACGRPVQPARKSGWSIFG